MSAGELAGVAGRRTELGAYGAFQRTAESIIGLLGINSRTVGQPELIRCGNRGGLVIGEPNLWHDWWNASERDGRA